MTREFLRFTPTIAPADTDSMPRYLDETFENIRAVLELLRDGHIDVTYAAPDKPSQGDIRYADGTSWNPGSGEGIYFYDSGGSWVKL